MIKLIVIGKLKEKYLVNMIEDYYKRINKYHKLEILEIPDTNISEEGNKILSKMDKAYNIALAIEGDSLNSIEFSNLIDKTLMDKANINFIIGGSEGLSKEVLKKCDKHISFSKLTFPHGVFRAILLEQIYRSFKILKNERYHK